MARAATAGELTKLRTSGQWSKLYLAIQNPSTVFSCQVNQSFDTTDQVIQVTYDGGSGDYTDVLPGMTVWVGSAAGQDDLGQCRVRLAATDTILYLGETSEIAWTDDLYLTVVDEFGLWAKHMTRDGNTPRMDQDISYTNQHLFFDPIPVMGPDAVLWLSGGSASLELDGSDSWVIGSTISSYAWTVSGTGGSLADETTDSPTFTATQAGTFRIGLTVTSADGKTFTGYRTIFVFDPAAPPPSAQLKNCAGDWESGGYSFSVTMVDEAGLDTVRDRVKCILFAVDYYGSDQASIGPITGYENILAIGWIDGETIDYSADRSEVSFTVRAANHWLDQIPGFAAAVKNSADTPTDWLSIEDLTVRAGLWHFLHWRSTATAILDVDLTADDRLIAATDAPAGSLWAQLNAIARRIQAVPFSDRYGRLHIHIDTQLTPVADRASIPTVMAIAAGDWDTEERIRIERCITAAVSLLEISGSSYDGTTETQLISRAPGNIYKRFGNPRTVDQLQFEDQSEANTMAGLLLAQMNNPYPHVSIPLAMNNRLIDLAPNQYVTLSIAEGDTPRGITWTDKKLVPRRVSYRQDEKTGMLLTDIECEAETTGTGQPAGITIIPPQPPQTNIPPTSPIDTPEFPIVPPGNIWFPPIIPTDPGLLDCMNDPSAAGNGPFAINFDKSVINEGEIAYAYFPCGVRRLDALHPTQLYFNLGFVGSPGTYDVFAIDSGRNPILSASWIDSGVAQFGAPAGLSVAGFAISVTGGTGYYYATAVTEYNDGYGGSWNGTLVNVLGAPDGVLASYSIPTALGSSHVTVTFGRVFPNGGVVTIHSWTSDPYGKVMAILGGSVVGTFNLSSFTVNTAFDAIQFIVDPPAENSGTVDAVSVQAEGYALLDNAYLYNICAG